MTDPRITKEMIGAEPRRVRLDHLLGVYAVGSGEWSWQEEYSNLIGHPRTHALRNSVEVEGIREPILLGADGRVWDGHHRIVVAMSLGLDSVPVEFAGQPGVKPVPTPTTAEVRERFIDGLPMDTWAVSREECGREFDRWLAKVRAEAWDEGWVSAMQYEGRCQDAEAAGQGVFITKPKNPYRTTERTER